eukprot:TRINITY_DN4029_c0_g1_i2.p1 TRINITY_DN4029_c0_g1~~TRINITY_DN4029_c0_g1_i2.p1  ORF type:complete len:220 (-),score=75.61 TRINITY_DN4029_c0_g1_i2:45-704(-)
MFTVLNLAQQPNQYAYEMLANRATYLLVVAKKSGNATSPWIFVGQATAKQPPAAAASGGNAKSRKKPSSASAPSTNAATTPTSTTAAAAEEMPRLGVLPPGRNRSKQQLAQPQQSSAQLVPAAAAAAQSPSPSPLQVPQQPAQPLSPVGRKRRGAASPSQPPAVPPAMPPQQEAAPQQPTEPAPAQDQPRGKRNHKAQRHKPAAEAASLPPIANAAGKQ